MCTNIITFSVLFLYLFQVLTLQHFLMLVCTNKMYKEAEPYISFTNLSLQKGFKTVQDK